MLHDTPIIRSLLYVLISVLAIYSDDIVITNIKDSAVNCDYLIIAPSMFQQSAVLLAEHRNSYQYDDVEKARVVPLDSIYSEFTLSDTLEKHEVIWYGLKWMYENWNEPFKYLVLMGDDSLIVNEVDTTVTSFGRMPTFIKEVTINPNGGHRLTFSDDWYTTLHCDTPTTSMDELYGVPIAIGRIPCETDLHSNMYVDKVINFDLHSPKGLWRNRSLLCADDEFQGSGPDYIQHWLATENIANNSLTAYFTSKCYLSFFPIDNVGHKPEATNYFFDHINKGALWTVYYGHGNHRALSDENFLETANVSRFDNENMPTIILIFSCTNGSYHLPFSNSMCKQFLLKPTGGCITYIASPLTEFASMNERFGSEIFDLLKSNPQLSVGKIIYTAKKNIMNTRSFYDYSVLGDPALTPSKRTETLKLIINESDTDPSSVTCTVLSAMPFTGNYYCTFSIQDSVTIDNGGSVKVNYIQDSIINTSEGKFITSFEVPIPGEIADNDLKFIAYVWDSLSEGRADTLIPSGITYIIANPSTIKENVSVQLRNSKLMVNYIAKNNDYITKIDLFNIRGQHVFAHSVPPNTSKVMINLLQKNIAPGNYIVRINTKKASFNKCLLFVK